MWESGRILVTTTKERGLRCSPDGKGAEPRWEGGVSKRAQAGRLRRKSRRTDRLRPQGTQCCCALGTFPGAHAGAAVLAWDRCSSSPWHWSTYLLMWHPKWTPHPSCWGTGAGPTSSTAGATAPVRGAGRQPGSPKTVPRNALDSPSSARHGALSHRVSPEFTDEGPPPGAGHRLGLWGQSGQPRPWLTAGRGGARQHVPPPCPQSLQRRVSSREATQRAGVPGPCPRWVSPRGCIGEGAPCREGQLFPKRTQGHLGLRNESSTGRGAATRPIDAACGTGGAVGAEAASGLSAVTLRVRCARAVGWGVGTCHGSRQPGRAPGSLSALPCAASRRAWRLVAQPCDRRARAGQEGTGDRTARSLSSAAPPAACRCGLPVSQGPLSVTAGVADAPSCIREVG